MRIRQADFSDVKILKEIISVSYQTVADRFGFDKNNCPKHPSNCTEEWVNAGIKKGVKYFILNFEGKDIGCVALEKADSETCYLERLAVTPEMRKKGLGKYLVDHVFNEAKLLGCEKISIGIIAKQTELKNWYSKIGFREGITKSFDHLPFDVTFMECDII